MPIQARTLARCGAPVAPAQSECREDSVITHSVDLTIARPVEEVFAFLTDARNHPRWDTTSVVMEPQENGPWHQGLVFREVRRIPRPTEVRSRIADFEANERFDMESLSGPSFRGHWRFAPEGTGTRLRWSCEMEVSGLARLFEPLIQRQFRRTVSRNFQRLKALLETPG
jgi:carbon monoxide dehydrogenase subunit G